MSTKVTSCPSYIALKEVWEKAKGWKAQSLIGGITRVRPDSGDNIYQLPRVYKEPVFRSKEEYEAALSDMCMIARFNPKGFPTVDDVYKANETICTCGEHHRIYLPEDPMLFNYEIESEIAEYGAVYAGDVLIRLHPKGEPPPQEQDKWNDALEDFRNALVKAFDNLPVETNSSFPKMSAAAKLLYTVKHLNVDTPIVSAPKYQTLPLPMQGLGLDDDIIILDVSNYSLPPLVSWHPTAYQISGTILPDGTVEGVLSQGDVSIPFTLPKGCQKTLLKMWDAVKPAGRE